MMGIRFTLSISFMIPTFMALAGNSPTIAVSNQSTPYLDLSNKSASAVLDDPTDPLVTLGIDFIITDEEPGAVTFTCSSNKTAVVPNNAANLIVSGTGTTRNLKIKGKGVGYATLTITVKDKEGKSATYALKYALSAAATLPAQHHFFTHLSSASTGIAIGTDYMWIGDDEYNELSLYNRKQSGMPLAIFDPTSLLKLPDPDAPEVDIEASCMSPTVSNRCYWIGSMSNSKSGDQKPNRDRLFATDLSGTGIASKISFVGYTSLRSQIISWGDAHGYNLTASTKTGIIPKQIDGFSLEGMEFAPDQKTLYLGFRAPFVPTNNRTKALICPLLNFETWFNNGTPIGKAVFGDPIELNLGGRGIRSICKNSDNQYIIIAGAFDGTSDFAIFQWSGFAFDAPVLYPDLDFNNLNPEGIVEVPNLSLFSTSIELINDQGTSDWYNDDKESKDLSTFEFQKFSTSWVTLQNTVTTLTEHVQTASGLTLYPNPVLSHAAVSFDVAQAIPVTLRLTDLSGRSIWQKIYQTQQGNNILHLDLSDIPPGFYTLQIPEKAILKLTKE